jgi:hypothetical protein
MKLMDLFLIALYVTLYLRFCPRVRWSISFSVSGSVGNKHLCSCLCGDLMSRRCVKVSSAKFPHADIVKYSAPVPIKWVYS